ncbi:MAG: T9SS type A sorting domain-containing protein [Janthinobacterium lividum]
MNKFFTLPALVAFTAASLTAQAQFTIDGTLNANEIGTGTGKYQLVGTYTGTHSVADRGLKALYVGTTATTLNIMVVSSPEIAGYNSLVLYLDVPGKTGVAAGTRLPGSNSTNSPLRTRPTLDMPTDYGFRITTSPLADANGGAMYLSRVDYTVTAPTGGYTEIGMGTNPKNGTVTNDSNDPAGASAQTAFKTGTTGSVAANTSTGWEFQMPLAALGGVAAGGLVNLMVAYVADDTSYNSDVLPQITSQTASLGIDPNFSNIAGKQYYTYQVGTGVLATRSAGTSLQASAYPNPVVADSRLIYTVADQTQPVTVEAFNSLGQRAALLLDATQAPGEHSVALAPLHQLAPGVYLVRVRAGSQLTSQRVVVN